jgi:hypothetical protein
MSSKFFTHSDVDEKSRATVDALNLADAPGRVSEISDNKFSPLVSFIFI